MTAFFLAVASFILLMVALGLVRILRGPDTSDRLMAAQLIGSGGVAVLLLLSASMRLPSTLAPGLLSAISSARHCPPMAGAGHRAPCE